MSALYIKSLAKGLVLLTYVKFIETKAIISTKYVYYICVNDLGLFWFTKGVS